MMFYSVTLCCIVRIYFVTTGIAIEEKLNVTPDTQVEANLYPERMQ